MMPTTTNADQKWFADTTMLSPMAAPTATATIADRVGPGTTPPEQRLDR